MAGSPVLGVLATHNPLGASFLTGMKTTVSEAEHPLLCEGTRREKGDLALALMITYKDDQARLKKVRGCGTGVNRQREHILPFSGGFQYDEKGLFFKEITGESWNTSSGT